MSFVQIVEYTTSRPDEMQALGQEFVAARQGDGGPTQVIVYKDRDTANRYLVIGRFPSYEVAMASSSAPETQEFAAKMAALCDGPPTFRNLDEHYVAFDG